MSYGWELERYKNDPDYVKELKDKNRENCRFRYQKKKAKEKEQKKCRSLQSR